MKSEEDPATQTDDSREGSNSGDLGGVEERDLASAEAGRKLRGALKVLEAVVEDRALLVQLTKEEQGRLLQAAANVWCPEPSDRRRLVKARRARRKRERVEREEADLRETGIRALRRKGGATRPNFTTPNVFRHENSRQATRNSTPEELRPEERSDEVGMESRPTAQEAFHCYVCKRDYSTLHPFYDQLCRECGDFNFAKRSELADLEGRVALVTGGRVKIGYQAALKMLRSGAKVIVSTRFPRDGAMRYAQEPDFDDWCQRLQIYGLDLRHTPSVEAFCGAILARYDRLDYIINNACQTVRRPPAFYRHMMAMETAALESMEDSCRPLLLEYESLRASDAPRPSAPLEEQMARDSVAVAAKNVSQILEQGPGPVGMTAAAELSQVPLLPDERSSQKERGQGDAVRLFPEGEFDEDLQQVDLRGRNSWRMLLAEVPTVELLEVHLVNAVAPFLLNARLKPLLLSAPGRDKHVVNVSAVEGQFYRNSKTTRHPHTNMAKASLNMMTRTSAADYYNDGIHMNSVDTGWVTDEDAAAIAQRKVEEHRFHPPLDIVDGAARITDPIIHGANTGEHIWGRFLKDYKPTDW